MVGKIYLLVRAKRLQSLDGRLKEILKSRCFNVLRDKLGKKGFYDFAFEKIIPVQGDLISDNLGMSDEDRQMIIDNVEVIINSAASVSFLDTLHDALKINYFGSLKMFELG